MEEVALGAWGGARDQPTFMELEELQLDSGLRLAQAS
jgi:hypothetical protein